MSANEVHKDDIGTVFEVALMDGSSIVNVSAATTKEIIFEKPDGSTLTKTAEFVTSGSDGKIDYTTVAGDLDTIGRWKIQAYVVLAAGSWKSDVAEFSVHDNL